MDGHRDRQTYVSLHPLAINSLLKVNFADDGHILSTDIAGSHKTHAFSANFFNFSQCPCDLYNYT